jgi:hypothetical protein
MALNGTVLKNGIKSAILAELQTKFPMPSGLQAGEQTAFTASQDKIAEAIAFGDGPSTVGHIITAAVVSTGVVGTVTTGAGSGGVVAGTGTGTVS